MTDPRNPAPKRRSHRTAASPELLRPSLQPAAGAGARFFQAQMPEYAHHLGSDDAGAWYSVLLGANAAGAVIGALALETTTAVRPSPTGSGTSRSPPRGGFR